MGFVKFGLLLEMSLSCLGNVARAHGPWRWHLILSVDMLLLVGAFFVRHQGCIFPTEAVSPKA